MTFTNVGVLHKKIAATGLAVGLAHHMDTVNAVRTGPSMTDLLQHSSSRDSILCLFLVFRPVLYKAEGVGLI